MKFRYSDEEVNNEDKFLKRFDISYSRFDKYRPYLQQMVKEEIKEILNAEGVSPEYIIRLYKDIADISERDSDRLRSLDALAKMSGLFETDKKQEQLTVWAGFSPEQLEAIKSDKTEQKVLAHAEREE